MKTVEGMVKEGSLELHKDKEFQENPMEREDEVESCKVENIKVRNKGILRIKNIADTSVIQLEQIKTSNLYLSLYM